MSIPIPESAESASPGEPAAHRYKRPVSVLVLIATRDGQVLLMERTRPRGFWQSVTGSLRWGEAAPVAARRELMEETGFSARGLQDLHRSTRFPILPAWQSRYAPGVRSNREHWFVLMLDRPERPRLAPDEHRRWRWLPAARAMRLASSRTNRQLIRDICGV